MTLHSGLQIALYLIVLGVLAKPLGWYMARVYEGKPCGLDRALGWLERLIYRAAGIDPQQEMTWKSYAVAMLAFNALGLFFVYGLQRLQRADDFIHMRHIACLGEAREDRHRRRGRPGCRRLTLGPIDNARRAEKQDRGKSRGDQNHPRPRTATRQGRR